MPLGSILSLTSFALVLLCSPIVTLAAPQDGGLIQGIDKLLPAEIESRLPNAHPVNYYVYAGRLWAAGDKDKAVFWRYVGQLRYRFLLLTEPHADPSGDPAMFASFQETIGRPIDLYAGSDTTKWAEEVNEVLKWDEANPNGFTSKTKYSKQWDEARASLVKLREYVLAHAEDIKTQRAQQGVGEVGVVNGVYVEEIKRRMPSDWPALEPNTSADRIVGVYKGSLDLANALFSADRPKVLRATTFDISRDGNNGILVVARKGEEELLRRTIPVREENGAVVFEELFHPDYFEGTTTVTSYLHVNTDGELVIQRDLVSEGKYRNRPMPFREAHTFWVRASRSAPQ